MDPKDISIADYSYDLPQENIAFYPLAERDASKLLIYRDGQISETSYRDIGAHLPEGTLLVFNNTKVVEARIVFQKPTGGQIEIFCLEPPKDYGGIAVAMAQTGKVQWKCLVGGASKWKPGQILRKVVEPIPADASVGGSGVAATAEIILKARFLGKEEDAFLIELSWSPVELSFADLLHRAGLIPLPPYIRRPAELTDSQRYQTIYARFDGSVAAPTAGLHFTEAVFSSLAERGIRRSWVTLHVGAGTFLPVKTAKLGEHPMHIEFITVGRETILELVQALLEGRPVVPVGTTSARTIESLYWLGLKVQRDPDIRAAELVVKQWDAYELAPQTRSAIARGSGRPDLAAGEAGAVEAGDAGTVEAGDAGTAISAAPDAVEALRSLMDWMKKQGLTELTTTTQLLITPGYDWKIAKGLVTNFHQPESTLLLLIASLVGKEWKRIYAYALEHGFRFLSYGDGCLFWGNKS
ncbi:MAG TPA: S-adenosylmethionine:tRNA ribosyltransferase-isomerase [Puia sp.]|nr:S-adenosylmethionine:tRNA ribosyltransferase-isomerase [Puia sp.]